MMTDYVQTNDDPFETDEQNAYRTRLAGFSDLSLYEALALAYRHEEQLRTELAAHMEALADFRRVERELIDERHEANQQITLLLSEMRRRMLSGDGRR
jgi:hypothetical protein